MVHADVPSPDAGGGIDVAEFRSAMARYATGVVVVTTVVDGIDHAMTANSFTSVSLEPPLVLVCVERESRFHAAVQAAGEWAVSVLPAGTAAAARWFAAKGRPLPGQLDRVRYTRSVRGLALLDGALATFECRTVATHPAGDHDVVVGAVTSLGPVNREAAPLVYFGSRFRELGQA